MEWKNIDSAPKDGNTILLGFLPVGNLLEGDRRVYEGRWNKIQKMWTSVNGFLTLNSASHWMPLPDPPEINQHACDWHETKKYYDAEDET